MASGPITSWQIDGETVADFIFWGSKITVDGDCSHEIKRHFLLGRKVMTNLDSIFKSRDITLLACEGNDTKFPGIFEWVSLLSLFSKCQQSFSKQRNTIVEYATWLKVSVVGDWE